MDYKDIKSVEDLGKWSSEKYSELEAHAYPYPLYHADFSIGDGDWVSESRFYETLGTEAERSLFIAYKNDYDVNELIEHLFDEPWLQDAASESIEYGDVSFTDDVEKFSEMELEVLSEQCPERIGPNGLPYEYDPEYFDQNGNPIEKVDAPVDKSLAGKCVASKAASQELASKNGAVCLDEMEHGEKA